MTSSEAVCIIPARMGSSRFPGKPLVSLLGLPLVLHVFERCRLCNGLSRVIIATCDDEIRAAAEVHGAEVIMTSDRHERATDRVDEAVRSLVPNLSEDHPVVMVQGDEVLAAPEMIDSVLAVQTRTKAQVVNLASRIHEPEQHDNPNVVKVAADPKGRVLYFSRAAIPSRTLGGNAPWLQQTGIMAFTAGFLRRFGEMPQTPLEIAESVDMLRVLENQIPIYLATTDLPTLGVDTPADRERGEALLRADPHTPGYLEVSS